MSKEKLIYTDINIPFFCYIQEGLNNAYQSMKQSPYPEVLRPMNNFQYLYTEEKQKKFSMTFSIDGNDAGYLENILKNMSSCAYDVYRNFTENKATKIVLWKPEEMFFGNMGSLIIFLCICPHSGLSYNGQYNLIENKIIFTLDYDLK